MKGFFITMDAVAGILVVLLVISTAITLVESTKQKSAINLTRQARDLIDYGYSGGTTDPTWIKTNCALSNNVASINSYKYDAVAKSISKTTIMVCE